VRRLQKHFPTKAKNSAEAKTRVSALEMKELDDDDDDDDEARGPPENA